MFKTLLKNTVENINTFIQSHKSISEYYEEVNNLNIDNYEPYGKYVLNNATFSTVSKLMQKQLDGKKSYVLPNIIDNKPDVNPSKK